MTKGNIGGNQVMLNTYINDRTIAMNICKAICRAMIMKT